MNNHSDRKLTGKTVVITGASSGFGKGAARAFSERGANLVLAARRENLLVELAAECQQEGRFAIPVPTDVSLPGDVENLWQRAVENFGRIDVWINDAGVGALGRFEEVPLGDHAQVVATNLLGTIYGSYFALKQFRLQQAGILINIASALGKIPAPYYASYTASKYGVVGLSAALRQELCENKIKDIRVCTVLPMAMDTPFFDHVSNYTGHEPTPIPPLYDPQDVVEAIVKVAIQPEDEIIVGGAGRVANVAHHVAPAITEGFMAHQTHRNQMEKAGPAPDSVGAVHSPSQDGVEVSAGRRK